MKSNDDENISSPIIAPKVFTKKQCESIISFHSDWSKTIGTVGGGKKDFSFRQCVTYTPPSTNHIPKWLGNEILKAIVFINERTYNFDLGDRELELVLLRYDLGGHYETHIDIGHLGLELRRKISLSLFLNDSYKGGKLKFLGITQSESKLKTEMGDMIMFPSYLTHKVEPVTSGVRWVLVGWILGNKHFR